MVQWHIERAALDKTSSLEAPFPANVEVIASSRIEGVTKKLNNQMPALLADDYKGTVERRRILEVLPTLRAAAVCDNANIQRLLDNARLRTLAFFSPHQLESGSDENELLVSTLEIFHSLKKRADVSLTASPDSGSHSNPFEGPQTDHL